MNKVLKKIVVTGGSKTERQFAVSKLYNYFTTIGWRVITIGDASAEFAEAGINDSEFHDPSNRGLWLSYKAIAMKYQMEKENNIMNLAYNMDAEKVLIVCNLGLMDVAGNMLADDFFHCIRLIGDPIDKVLRSYDAVFYLDYEETVSPWASHPEFRIVSINANPEKLSHEVLAFLGEDKKNIERKFLIETPDTACMEELDHCKFKTVFIQGFEVEGSVTECKRCPLDFHCSGNLDNTFIRRMRYYLSKPGQSTIIEIYPFSGRAFMKIVVPGIGYSVEIPSFVHLIREVTNEVGFTELDLFKRP